MNYMQMDFGASMYQQRQRFSYHTPYYSHRYTRLITAYYIQRSTGDGHHTTP